MEIINNRGEGMTFVINAGSNFNRIIKIKKLYPNASIVLEKKEKAKVQISEEELKMLGLTKTDVPESLLEKKSEDKKLSVELTFENLAGIYFEKKKTAKDTRALAA